MAPRTRHARAPSAVQLSATRAIAARPPAARGAARPSPSLSARPPRLGALGAVLGAAALWAPGALAAGAADRGAEVSAVASASSSRSAIVQHAISAAAYTQNIVCVPNRCVNPVFPALYMFGRSTLSESENKTWQCVSPESTWRDAGFCGLAIAGYPFAIPAVPGFGSEHTEKDVMLEQSRLAMRAYVAHLTGLGENFWEYTEPWNAGSCIQEIWKLACYTYFPRCNLLRPAQYLRPCRSACQAYKDACQVRCCDEGNPCVFVHRRQLPNGQEEQEEGYADHAGPSAFCTGAAPRRHHAAGLLASMAAALAAAAMFGERPGAVGLGA